MKMQYILEIQIHLKKIIINIIGLLYYRYVDEETDVSSEEEEEEE